MNNKLNSRRLLLPTKILVITLFLFFAGVAHAQWTTGTDINNTNSGKVGIGTTGPTAKLEVSGTVAAPSSLATNPITSGTFVLSDTSGTVGAVMGTALNTYSYDTYLQARHLTTGNTAYNLLLQPLGGKVGIGTISPQTKLDVAGLAQAQGVSLNNGSYAGDLYWGNYSYAHWYMTGADFSSSVRFQTWDGSSYSDKVTFQNNGNVGIGTTSPAAKLHIVTTGIPFSIDAGNNLDYFSLATAASTTGISGRVANANLGNSSAWFGVQTNSDNNPNSGFYVKGTAGANPVLIASTNGNVGIGVNNPAVALDVHGDIQASGVIKAKYQDVAEWVPSSEQLSAGTVVVLDSTKPNQVTSSSVSYDTRVAGVVSEQPGIALGEKSESKVLVATTGRVRVKVDASKGAIHIGDLLVTSDVPGVAMKSEPVEFAGRKMHMPGTLIGKALEPLEKGKGEILVLLSLQ